VPKLSFYVKKGGSSAENFANITLAGLVLQMPGIF
jgi:hypothetical protein